ncbi:hypothetical protein [Flavobacterium sp.]|uniref:hypothetical protein n=1 Tax=Flavobacterium sp. TaxID=239 RepID=UPI002605977B|nr:hypothetical protein [Flavobacterium sp.]
MNHLEFIKPQRKSSVDDLAFPDSGETHSALLVPYKKLRQLGNTQSMWRNIVALYLYSAQLPVSGIAEFLSLSQSRVRAIIRLARKRIFVLPGYHQTPISIEGKQDFSTEEITAHRFMVNIAEMKAAEEALSYMNGIGFADTRVISAAMTVGREHFSKTSLEMQNAHCPCLLCERRKDLI